MTIPRLRYDRILWVLFLMVMGLVFLSSVAKKKGSLSKEIQVDIEPLESGAMLISERNVLSVLRNGFTKVLTHEPINRLDFERMETVLEADPFVLNADAYLDIHNRIHLKIDQREPVLRILSESGENYYIDPLGFKVPISPNYTARVMVATGNIQPYASDFLKQKNHTLTKLMHLRHALNEDDQLCTFVQQIHVDRKGEFWLVPLLGKQKIRLGTLADLEDKFENIKIFYENAMPYEGWNKYSTLDVRFEGQVVAKK